MGRDATCINQREVCIYTDLGGGIVWEGATILTRYLVQFHAPKGLRGVGVGVEEEARKGLEDGAVHILELGSGTGVCGLVAAGACSPLTPSCSFFFPPALSFSSCMCLCA